MSCHSCLKKEAGCGAAVAEFATKRGCFGALLWKSRPVFARRAAAFGCHHRATARGAHQRVNRTAPAREAIPHTTAGSSSSPQVSTIRLDGLFVALTTS